MPTEVWIQAAAPLPAPTVGLAGGPLSGVSYLARSCGDHSDSEETNRR